MKIGIAGVVALTIAVPDSAFAQNTNGTGEGQPPRNPLVISITGTNAEPDLFRDVSLTSYDLLTGSIQFKDANETAKVVFAPFKLRSSYSRLLSEVSINLTQGKGTTTLGTGIAYHSKTAFSKSAIAELSAADSSLKRFRNQRVDESEEEYDLARTAHLDAQWARIYDVFYSNLARRAWILSTGYNEQFFGVIAGDKTDVDEDGVIDNHYRRKGYDVSASLTYTFNQTTGVTVTGHFGERRQSAKENSGRASYPGFSFAFAQRVLVLNPSYKTSVAYLSSLFVPSIIVGGSLERIECKGTAATCEEGLHNRISITPFIEFKVSPEAQFRIGVPIRKSAQFGGKSKTELAPDVQYVLQLKGIK